MKYPIIVINFKTYPQATGTGAVKIAKAAEEVSKKKKIPIILAVQHADIYRVSQAVKLPIYAEHVDDIDPGRGTGFILPQSVILAGARGTLLNHAEHKLPHKVLKSTIQRCKKLKLTTLVCATDAKEASQIAKFNPDIIAVEPPALIGTGVSVSTANPKIVTSTVAAVKKQKRIPTLCGAGISTGEDVAAAIKLGTKGVLLASGVTKAKNPKKVLYDLVSQL